MRNIVCLLPAAGAVVTIVAGAVMACSDSDCAPRLLDLRALDWFAARRSSELDALFATITWLGSLWLLLPLALALIVSLAVRGRTAVASRFAAALGGAVVISYAAKHLVGRERPAGLESLAAMPPAPSFPSGHAMQITASALAVAWLLAPPAQRRLWLAVALTAIMLVAVSRVYLQVHFPSDVLAGAAAATLWCHTFAPRDQTQEQPQRA